MPITRIKIWNEFDEQALLLGIKRIPQETNQELRNRILNHEQWNSTIQGLTNYISAGLLMGEHNIIEKTAFISTYQPLSYAHYQTLTTKQVDYIEPYIVIGTDTWTISASSDFQKDESNAVNSITWSLWKQPNGVYDRVWTTTIAPSENIELYYQTVDENDNIKLVRETSDLLTWNDGEIIEEYPDE